MDGLQMSGWSAPKLGAARINAACFTCRVLVTLIAWFHLFTLSNLTLKVWLANLAFAVQGNPTLHTFSSIFTQLSDVLFAFCCASSEGHWYNVVRVIYSPTEPTVLGSSLFLLWAVRSAHDSQVQQKTLPSKAQLSEALGVFWAEQGLIRWQCPLRD